MDIQFNYDWEGTLALSKEGKWLFADRESWKTPVGDIQTTAACCEGLLSEWECIGKTFRDSDDSFDYGRWIEEPTKDVISWLAGKKESVQATNSMAVCIDNFLKSKDTQKDSYVISSSVVHTDMTMNIRGLGKLHPCWYYLNSGAINLWEIEGGEYLLALFRYLDGVDLTSKGLVGRIDERTIALLRSHRIQKTMKFWVDEQVGNRWKFQVKAEMRYYRKGSVCRCLPIPGKTRKLKPEPKSVTTPEMVVSSPNVIKAMNSLSQVWQDKFAESVLISAPPGSGKEQFSKTIAYGTGRIDPKDDLYSLSLADNQSSLERMLYGYREEGPIGWHHRGILNRAKDGVVFLDEVHYPEEGFGLRATLLRPLESKEYYPLGKIKPGEEPHKIDNVLLVLATSKPLKSRHGNRGLSEIKPVDFWTRMTHVISIRHPFESVWDKSLPDIMKHYFNFFWWERLEKYFKIDPENDLDTLDNGDTDTSRVDYKIRFAAMDTMRHDTKLKDLSKEFVGILLDVLNEENIQPYEVSIRGFRNMVTRVFSIAAEKVSKGYNFEPKDLVSCIEPAIYEIIEIGRLDS